MDFEEITFLEKYFARYFKDYTIRKLNFDCRTNDPDEVMYTIKASKEYYADGFKPLFYYRKSTNTVLTSGWNVSSVKYQELYNSDAFMKNQLELYFGFINPTIEYYTLNGHMPNIPTVYSRPI